MLPGAVLEPWAATPAVATSLLDPGPAVATSGAPVAAGAVTVPTGGDVPATGLEGGAALETGGGAALETEGGGAVETGG